MVSVAGGGVARHHLLHQLGHQVGEHVVAAVRVFAEEERPVQHECRHIHRRAVGGQDNHHQQQLGRVHQVTHAATVSLLPVEAHQNQTEEHLVPQSLAQVLSVLTFLVPPAQPLSQRTKAAAKSKGPTHVQLRRCSVEIRQLELS